MPKIYNSDLMDVNTGRCKIWGDNCVLISISDPVSAYTVNPVQKFKYTFSYEFLDIEDKTNDFSITDFQARSIAAVLQSCYDTDTDVLVHCFAGVCRSGAVAEVGEMLGFEYIGTYKQPNVLVKKKLMKQFGWTYEEQE